jgi:antitoxin VapB
MIQLSRETEDLARRLAAEQRLSVDEAIRIALEARGSGTQPSARRRMTVEEMLAIGAEIRAMPLLDDRSPAKLWMI